MNRETQISLKNVSKCYKRYSHPIERFKETFFPGRSKAEEFWALKDINLDVSKGDTLGIIGQNGSGKSTLLQIIAKTLTPTTGEVEVEGRISALLELGSGFNPEFTGRENVFFNAQLLGLTAEEIENRFDSIAAFADIGDFLNLPVKTYSSGMFVRLAFAVAVSVEPDILIVDEALAVGDIYFQQKCFDRLMQLREKGTTLLFVSHDMTSIYRLCNRAILMNSGMATLLGETRKVIELYEVNLVKNMNLQSQNLQTIESDFSNVELSENSSTDSTNLKIDDSILETTSLEPSTSSNTFNPSSLNSQKVKLQFVKTFDTNNRETNLIVSEDYIQLSLGILFMTPFDDPLIGFQLRDRTGFVVFQTNTFMMGHTIGSVPKNTLLETNFTFKVPLMQGEYTVTACVANKGIGEWSFEEALLLIYDAHIIKVVKNQNSIIWFGMVNLAPTVNIEKHEKSSF
jgi:lipopolysaccharide transport system ATP-binding protein